MRVIVSARGCTISATYREALVRRLGRLDRLRPKILDATLVLSREKPRRTAALTVVAKHHALRSAETAGALAAAVDRALAAMERQVQGAHRGGQRPLPAPRRQPRPRGAHRVSAREPGP